MPNLPPLPVEACLPALLEALSTHGAAVLRAPTGSGKTTRLPPALLALVPPGKLLVVLEPRRVAARAAAARVAFEQGWKVGEEVGYHVRFDRRAGARTRLLFATEGILLRRLVEDPLLEDVGALVFDEFHERNLDADLALALAAQARREVRSDLWLLVMSATLEAAPVATFLGAAPVIESAGRGYPVAIRHEERPAGREPRELVAAVARAVGEVWEETTGDVLVFLPGLGEIRAAADALGPWSKGAGARLVPLHGELPAADQDAALGRAAARRVVLATNLAESSITVPGVATVIDTGFARRPRFDPATGLDRLELVRISRASADQRAGRAGREGPGTCLRLWPRIEHASLPAADTPEVLRVDLASAALQLLAAGERDLAAFRWFQPPPAESLARALALLDRLGARNARGLTDFGRQLSRFPVAPRIGALLVAGHRRGVLADAALVAALLGDRSPFRRPEDRRQTAAHESRSDVLDRLDALERFERTGRDPGESSLGRLVPVLARALFPVRDRLMALAREHLGAQGRPAADRDEALLQALVEAFPDRVARRREPGSRRGLMVGGRGVALAPESAVMAGELFLAVELDGGPVGERAEARVRLASAVERDWLPPRQCTEAVEVDYEPAGERLRAYLRRRYQDLVLYEREVPLAEASPEDLGQRLAAAAASDPERAFGWHAPELVAFRARVDFLGAARPELGMPVLDGHFLAELVPVLAAGRRSFAELRAVPLLDFLRGRLEARQLAALEAEAPERLEVPSGSRIAIEYRGAEPPILAVRIQELFGLAETPRLAGGRVPLLLHLLAPNHRPQQVTSDLASFWSNTYPEVRKELLGRYPRHSWPLDPRQAVAERRPRRKV